MCRRPGLPKRYRASWSRSRRVRIVHSLGTWRIRQAARGQLRPQRFGKRYGSSCRDAVRNARPFQAKKNYSSLLTLPAALASAMSISEEQVRDALRSVRYPGFSRDIVSFGLVKGVDIDNGDIKVQLALATNDPNIPATIKNDAEKILREL